VSFGFDPDTQLFGGNAQNGVLGAFTSRESGDIASPGYLRNPLNPRLLGISRGSSGWVLTWTAVPGRNYTLQSASELGGAWTPLNTFPATDGIQSYTDTTGSSERRFYRVVLEP